MSADGVQERLLREEIEPMYLHFEPGYCISVAGDMAGQQKGHRKKRAKIVKVKPTKLTVSILGAKERNAIE